MNPDVLLSTYKAVLADVSSQAIIEAAQRFTAGDVPDQSRTFAPSVAEFTQEARNQQVYLETKARPRIPVPRGYVPSDKELPGANERMRLKMPMYAYAQRRGLMDQLDRANREGFGAMVVLATNWGVPIPQELLDRPEAEDEWRRARNRIWAEIEHNPPPFMRTKAWRERAS